MTNIDLNPTPMNQSTPKQIVDFNFDSNQVSCKIPKTTYPFHGVFPPDQDEERINTINTASNYGVGQGMNSLPGDNGSQSRFIKLYKLREAILKYSKPTTSDEATYVSSQLLNNCDICKGTIVIKTDKKEKIEYTLWHIIKDCLNQQMKIRTYGNFNWVHFDCKKFDYNQGQSKEWYDITNGEQINGDDYSKKIQNSIQKNINIIKQTK